jgi:hypothetical protein
VPSLSDYFLLYCGLLAELSVVALAVFRRDVRRHLPLPLFMLASASGSVASLYCLRRFGISSGEYLYFFYYLDCAVALLLYGVVAWCYACIIAETGARPSTRWAAVALPLVLAGFGLAILDSNPSLLMSPAVIDLERNLYFVGLLLTWLIWPGAVRLREQRPRWILLVLSLGVFFSGHAACFSLRSLVPSWSFPRMLPPVLELLLPLAWILIFVCVPEEGRLPVRAVSAPEMRRTRLA